MLMVVAAKLKTQKKTGRRLSQPETNRKKLRCLYSFQLSHILQTAAYVFFLYWYLPCDEWHLNLN